MLEMRIITGAVLTAIAIVVLLLSHLPWVLNIVAACLSVQSIYELYRAIGIRNKGAYYISSVFAIAISLIPIPKQEYILIPLVLASIIFFAYLMANVKKKDSVHMASGVFMALVITMFFRTVVSIRSTEQGIYWLVMTILTAVFSDNGAYFIGKAFGKHRLAPAISPNKTVEGSIGGIVSSLLLVTLISFILNATQVLTVQFGYLLIFVTVISTIGQFGDLALSSVKRIVGIKDYGKLLPGHGGILDRFDSLMFALPMAYLLSLIMKIFI